MRRISLKCSNLKHVFISAFICSLIGLLLPACQTEMSETCSNRQEIKEYRIAVVLPLDGVNEVKWKRMAEWAQENIRKAQQHEPKAVELVLEWYDESTADIETLGKELAQRSDLAAVIGPYASSNVQTMAYQLAKSNKTEIVTASSAELVRAFSARRFLWALSETDIAQCEVLLTRVLSYHANKVSLIAPDNIYGKTFSDWFAFQAKELDLNIGDVCVYQPENRDAVIDQVMGSDADYAICVPADFEDTKAMLEGQQKHSGACPRILFSDMAFTPELAELGFGAGNTEGVAMYAAPESGFEIAYSLRFGEVPTGGEPQFYDALMLAAFAAADCMHRESEDMNEAMMRVVSNTEQPLMAWTYEGMEAEFKGIASGYYYDIYAASGEMDFDKTVYTNVLQSVYANWVFHNGKFIIQDFCSTEGSRRTDASLAGWNWKIQKEQIFSEEQVDILYGPKEQNWALLIATSEGWSNYRHQADVLNMYRILKENGFTDDRIVLIMADDLAYHPQNPIPGWIGVRPDGENLYQDVTIDYRIGDLVPEDLVDILGGNVSERLPEVIQAGKQDNVLVFWSGHGVKGRLVWGERKDGFTTDLMTQTLKQLSDEKRFRKMLWLLETCYSSSVAKGCVGIPGVLCIAAADEQETSKADVFNTELGIWMSNRFTATLTEAIEQDPNITFRDLYYKLSQNTIGSHVRVHNDLNFASLYQSSISEFIQNDEK